MRALLAPHSLLGMPDVARSEHDVVSRTLSAVSRSSVVVFGKRESLPHGPFLPLSSLVHAIVTVKKGSV